jgi:TolA-binding protein
VKQQSLFAIFCLVLTLGIMLAHGAIRDHFSDSKELQKEVAYWKEQRERVELKTSLLQDQMRAFQVEVAKTIPEKAQLQNFDQKNLFSQLRAPASDLGIDLTSAEMERGRKFFREQSYSEAIEIFKELIEKYPSSGKAVEARFLLAESLFLSSQNANCIDQIEVMMTQYPENELTGFIMLRMGQVLQSRNRSVEATEVYRTVVRRFPSSINLKRQAENLIESSENL